MEEKYQSFYDSPIGRLEILATKTTLTNLNFLTEQTTQKLEKGKMHYTILNKENSIIKECKKQLEEYFLGKRKTFTLPLEMNGTEFQKKVWEELKKIPYGETRSYKQIAQKIGNEKAVRAVGGANNKNPIGIIVPCHRVIGMNHTLVGYAGGLDKKEYLLELERRY